MRLEREERGDDREWFEHRDRAGARSEMTWAEAGRHLTRTGTGVFGVGLTGLSLSVATGPFAPKVAAGSAKVMIGGGIMTLAGMAITALAS